jgi:hypothetical protein
MNFECLSGIHAVILTIPNEPDLELLTYSFQLVVGTLGPFIIILACNITIIVTLQSSSKDRKALDAGPQNKARDRIQRETAHLTRMLIAVSFAYILLTLSFRLYHLILKVPAVGSMYDLNSAFWKQRYVLQAWILMNIWNFNFAINFFLYCVGGGKRYRRDAVEVLRKLRC